MRRLVVVALLLVLIAAYVGCRDDVFVEPPPSLTGDYEGTYTLSVPSQQDRIEFVRWQFRADSYIMRFDTTVDGNDPISCNSLGNYTLANNVELEVLDPDLDGGIAGSACDQSLVPQGVYGLDQSTAGVVFMRQVRGDTTFEIRLEGPLN
ncbi:MAG: hypothetical protein RBT76_01575 [candidate division Zixibacteria bacterium]|jgi:hypothetical protein|nr:hypothetical protein [candidate division Zixibacteria bacterium]